MVVLVMQDVGLENGYQKLVFINIVTDEDVDGGILQTNRIYQVASEATPAPCKSTKSPVPSKVSQR